MKLCTHAPQAHSTKPDTDYIKSNRAAADAAVVEAAVSAAERRLSRSAAVKCRA